MGAKSTTLESYASSLLQLLQGLWPELRLVSLTSSSDKRYRSSVKKVLTRVTTKNKVQALAASSSVVKEDVSLLLGKISLNYGKLQTKGRVRVALAHELAHLLPTDQKFRKRWSEWCQILKELDRSKVLEETRQTK